MQKKYRQSARNKGELQQLPSGLSDLYSVEITTDGTISYMELLKEIDAYSGENTSEYMN